MSHVKVLCIGDPHFKNDNELQTDMMEAKLSEILKRENPDITIVLGDTLHTHEKINMNCLRRATSFFRTLRVDSPHLYILIGNHDRPNNNVYMTDEHPFNGMKEWGEDVTVVDKTLIASHKGFKFAFVPYVPAGRFAEAMESVDLVAPYSELAGIFAHQEFKGAKMNAITSNIGDVYTLESPMCVSGHIHDYDDLQSNMIYTGTPIQHGFADRTDKTISIFEYSTLSDDSKKVGMTKHTRLKLGIPKKLNLKMTIDEFLDYKHDGISNVKITIRGVPSEVSKVLKTEHARDLITSGIKIKEAIPEKLKVVTHGYEPRLKVGFGKRLTDQMATEDDETRAVFYNIFPKFAPQKVVIPVVK